MNLNASWYAQWNALFPIPSTKKAKKNSCKNMSN